MQTYLVANAQSKKGADYPDDLSALISISSSGVARSVIEQWPGYGVTPLLSLDTLADEAGVKAVYYKDEASRFGLGSFKALGGAYAVFCLLKAKIEKQTGTQVSVADVLARTHADIAAGYTVACATAGNHGRSVAWGAQLFGCPCHIYLHKGVGPDRADAIAKYGAVIHRVDGNYDDSVRAAASDAERHDWTIVSDTSYPGYMDIPKFVMQGYAVMFDEIVQQLGATTLSHVFAQGGVGGLASAAAGCFWDKWGSARPELVVVEPDHASCLFESARGSKITTIDGALDTHMLGLACGEPSVLAWDILSRGADYFMTIPDSIIFDEIRQLKAKRYGNESIIAGESAVAGLAGFRRVAADPYLRKATGLDENSTVLLFGTEGDTDPAMYKRIIDEGYNGTKAA